MKKWSRALLGIVLSFAVLLSGCGGESKSASDAGSAPSATIYEFSEPPLPSESSAFGAEESPSRMEAEASLPEQGSSVSSEQGESSVGAGSKPAAEVSKEPEKEFPSDPAESSCEESSPAQNPESAKDQYLTDPIPEGKPKPVEPQDADVDKETAYSCILSIRCDTILDNMDDFNMDKESVLPSDGTIFAEKTVTFYEGESVFDVLLRETKNAKIHMEFESTPMYNSNYIEGIHNLYEFDCGPLSGWMYRVNDWFPNYGCSRYQLNDGDRIEWLYTCDLGRDLGCEWLE